MTLYQFGMEVDRLKQAFGEKFYNPARTGLLFSIIKDVDAEFFSRWVDRMLIDSRHAPMGPEFREMYDKWCAIKRKQTNPDERLCKVCGDDGQLLAIKKDDESKWAFLCPFCDAAKEKGMDKRYDKTGAPLPARVFWREDLMSIYTVKPVEKYVPSEILFD